MLIPLVDRRDLRDSGDDSNRNEKGGMGVLDEKQSSKERERETRRKKQPSQWILPLMHGHVDQASTFLPS